MERIGYNLIQSSLCNIGIVWIKKGRSIKVARLFLFQKGDDPHKEIKRVFPVARQKRSKEISFISKSIKCYLEGEITRFKLSNFQKTLCSKFQWEVLLAARRVSYGKVITYKNLAELIGAKSARAVGNALAKNPFPIIMPCHRVVCFNRKIGGFQSGKNLKKNLLKLEGIEFDKKGRISEDFFV